MDELGHEFEDGRGACWVVVPELDGSLQNGHVGWISAGLRSGTFSDRLMNNKYYYSSDCSYKSNSVSAVRIHPVKQHHEARLGVEGERDSSKVSNQTDQRPLQEAREEENCIMKCTKY